MKFYPHGLKVGLLSFISDTIVYYVLWTLSVLGSRLKNKVSWSRETYLVGAGKNPLKRLPAAGSHALVEGAREPGADKKR